MSRISYRLPVYLVQVDEDRVLAGSLFNVNYSSIGHYPEQALDKLKALLEKALPEDSCAHYADNLSAEDITVETLTLTVAAHHENDAWKKRLTVSLPVVRYRKTQPEGREYWVGFVPWLELSFSSRDEEGWAERGENEIKRHLLRIGGNRNLKTLVETTQAQEVTLDYVTMDLDYPSTLDRLKGKKAKQPCPVESNARQLTRDKNAQPTFGRDGEIQRLADALMRERRCGILLVGPSGVGKSAIVREMVQRRVSMRLTRLKFYETNGARLIAGRSGFGEWQEAVGKMIDEAASKNYVLLLGSLFELSNVGQSANMHQGIAAFLRPHIASGRLAVICECTAEHYEILSKKEPNLLQAFERIDIEEPDAAGYQSMIEAAADYRQKRFGVTISAAARDQVAKLFERFAAYSAKPGPALRFLDNMCLEAERGDHIDKQQVITQFSQLSGLPAFLLDRKLPMSLAETQGFFESAIIGQRRAIGHLVDMLATIKEGLTVRGRPISSLLFIGPTGVGKTETAKALAKRMFGDARRLTRFDMSEFADEIGVRRLLAGNAKEAGLLTALVREQPFSLLVFDEFEKAHPQFFDLLLQILGDARLTDDYGRTARFDNTVIIMTSNLGAERFDRGRIAMVAGSGNQDPAQQHFTHEVRRFLRPEIYNRIDVIVPFHGLDREDIAAVTQLELAKLKQRAGLTENGLTLTVAPAVVDELVAKGYDAKLGARALKRAVDKYLALPLAKYLARGELKNVAGFAAHMGDNGVVLDEVPAPPNRKIDETHGITTAVLSTLANLRRNAEKTSRSYHLERVRSRLENLNYRLHRHLKQVAVNPKTKPLWNRAELHQQIQLLGNDLKNLDQFLNDLREYENLCQEVWHGFAVAAKPEPGRTAELQARYFTQLITFFRYQTPEPDLIVLGLFGPKRDLLEKMAGFYITPCLAEGMSVKATLYFTKNQKPTAEAGHQVGEPDPLSPADKRAKHDSKVATLPNTGNRVRDLAERNIFLRQPQADVTLGDDTALSRLLTDHPDDIHGLALEIKGANAGIHLAGEGGYHVWDDDDTFVLVDLGRKPVAQYSPPAGVVGAPPRVRPARRHYDTKAKIIRDSPGFAKHSVSDWSSTMVLLRRNWLFDTLLEVFNA